MTDTFGGYTFGRGKTSRSSRHELFLALEIENPTPEVKDLSFFGIRRRHYQETGPTGLKVRSIIGDKLYDNPDLTEFFDLCSLHPINIRGYVFNTSMLYDMFKGKHFHVNEVNAYGTTTYQSVRLLDYWTERTPQSVIVDSDWCLDISINLKLTCIQPGERIVLFFDTSGRKSEGALEAMIIHANSIYNKEKTRKILLII